jgi:hypothetical protein
MIVNLSAVLKDLDGKPLPPQDGKALKVGDACVFALVAVTQNDTADGGEKFKRWEIARKINGLLEVDLSVEEIAKCKELVGKTWSTVVVGAVWTALEGKEV